MPVVRNGNEHVKDQVLRCEAAVDFLCGQLATYDTDASHVSSVRVAPSEVSPSVAAYSASS